MPACMTGAMAGCDTPETIALPKDDEIYVREYRLNGKKVTDPHIPFADVVKGGKLEIKMGAEPVETYHQ